MISSHNQSKLTCKIITSWVAYSEAFLEIWLCKCHMNIDKIDNRNTENDVKNPSFVHNWKLYSLSSLKRQ